MGSDLLDTFTVLFIFGTSFWLKKYFDPEHEHDRFFKPPFIGHVTISQMYQATTLSMLAFQILHLCYVRLYLLRNSCLCIAYLVKLLLGVIFIAFIGLVLLADWYFIELGKTGIIDVGTYFLTAYILFFFGSCNCLIVITVSIYIHKITHHIVLWISSKRALWDINDVYIYAVKTNFKKKEFLEKHRNQIEYRLLTRREIEKLIQNYMSENRSGMEVCCECDLKIEYGDDMISLPVCCHKYHKTCLLQRLLSYTSCKDCKQNIRIELMSETREKMKESKKRGKGGRLTDTLSEGSSSFTGDWKFTK